MTVIRDVFCAAPLVFSLWALVLVAPACTKQNKSEADPPAPVATKASSEPLRFGVLPATDPVQQEKLYAPLMSELGKLLKRGVSLVVPKNYEALYAQLAAGQIHLGQMSPYVFVKTTWQSKIPTQVLAFERLADEKRHRGVFVVKKESPLKNVAELAGRSCGFVDQASSSGYHYPRMRLRQLGHDPDKFFGSVKLGGSHDRVLEMVLADEVDAGAVSNQALLGQPSLRVLETTEEVPDDAVVSVGGLSEEETTKVTRFFLEAQDNPALFSFLKNRGVVGYIEGNVDIYKPQQREMGHSAGSP